MLLAGLYEDWVDALLVAAGTGVLGAFRLGLLGGLPSKWIRLLQRVPTLIRYGVALAVGVLVAHPVIHSLWGMGNFRPVLLAGFIILVMFYLLFPSPLLPGAGERRQAR